MEFELLYFFLLALSAMFIGACHMPFGFDRTHGVCSTCAVISAALAALLVAVSALD